VIVAGLLALTVNHWRESPLPLIGDWSVSARVTDDDGKNLTIPLDEAKQLFENKATLFLDARPQSQYEDGHISGALSLPWQDATNAFTATAAQLDTLVTYCDSAKLRTQSRPGHIPDRYWLCRCSGAGQWLDCLAGSRITNQKSRCCP